MRATIRVRFLDNHGVRVTRTDAHGKAERFEPFHGTVSVAEAAVALDTTTVKMYRLLERKEVKSRTIQGVIRVPVSELRRLRREPAALEDGRKRRAVSAA